MNWRSLGWLMYGCLLMMGHAWAQVAAAPIGLFADHADVGTVLHAGSAKYDAARHAYTIGGSGENVWAAADAFQFIWKKMEGNFTLTADISVLGQGGDPHKKAMLMARQSLDADSAYADVALHGVGLTSLQARDAKGAATHEIQSNVSAPRRLRLQKYGDEFTMWLAGDDGQFHFAGGSMRVPLAEPFYVGLGVCAHDKDAVETAEFSNVALEAMPASSTRTQEYATLETMTVASTDRRVTYVAPGHLEAPTWTPDSVSLVFRRSCGIEIVPVAGGEPKTVYPRTGLCPDELHGVSPDGTMLAVSSVFHNLLGDIYLVPIGGGTARRLTEKSPSTWAGWAADGKSIVFTGRRHSEYGIYTIPVAGGEETRLADAAPPHLDPECSPDGKYIYFSSSRSGATEIWRTRLDGSQPEQVTKDGAGSSCPHVSPDGRLLAFLTPQQRGSGSFPQGFTQFLLRVMSLTDGQIRVLAKLIGDRGSMPSPPWSPDSRRIAFVSYQRIRIDPASPPQATGPVIVK
jgi:Tol biopolymer transport system component